MTPSNKATTVRARGEDVPVLIVEPSEGEHQGPTRDLLYMHGYARHPLDYLEMLEALAARGWRVVAPFLFANNGLKRPPTHFWACASLAVRTVEALREEGLLASDAPAFGHSTGGAVTLTLAKLSPPPPLVMAINPVQPSRRWPIVFMCASAWMNTKMTLGLAGDGPRARRVLRESARRFYANWLRKPGKAFQLIGGLRSFDYERLARWYAPGPVQVPAHVVWGAGDEFYPHTRGLIDGLERTFEHATLEVLDDENSHEWLMVKVDRAAQIVDSAARSSR